MDILVLVSAFVALRLVILLMQIAIARVERPTPVARQRVDPCLGPVTGLPPRPLPTAEDILQARLLSGAMSREEYRDAMTRLAAEDDLSHPIVPF